MVALASDCNSPTTFGTVTSCGPVEIVMETVEPWAASVPAEGLWDETRPSDVSSLGASVTATSKPAPSSSARALDSG